MRPLYLEGGFSAPGLSTVLRFQITPSSGPTLANLEALQVRPYPDPCLGTSKCCPGQAPLACPKPLRAVGHRGSAAIPEHSLNFQLLDGEGGLRTVPPTHPLVGLKNT